jgi:hypothetical protein
VLRRIGHCCSEKIALPHGITARLGMRAISVDLPAQWRAFLLFRSHLSTHHGTRLPYVLTFYEKWRRTRHIRAQRTANLFDELVALYCNKFCIFCGEVLDSVEQIKKILNVELFCPSACPCGFPHYFWGKNIILCLQTCFSICSGLAFSYFV